MASVASESNEPSSFARQNLNNSGDEVPTMIIDNEEQGDAHLVVACRNEGGQSMSSDQIAVNGSGDAAVHSERAENADEQLTNMQHGLSKTSDCFIRVSAGNELDVVSHDQPQSVVSASHEQSVSVDSNSVLQAEVNAVDVALPSHTAADPATYLSPRNCEAVFVCSTECKSATSLVDTASLPRDRHDRHSVSSIRSDTCASNLGARSGSDILPNMVAISHSSEKLWSWSSRRERAPFDSQAVGVVRSSWSQENYFDDSDVTCVDIDLDDDDLASSVDVLHYRDSVASGEAPAHCWTVDDIGRSDKPCTGKLRSWAPLKGDEVFAELFSSDSDSYLDESECLVTNAKCDFQKKGNKTYGVGIAIDFDSNEDSTVLSSGSLNISHALTNYNGSSSSASNDAFCELSDDIASFLPSKLSDFAIRPSSKDVDRPSAARLAKRLYYLQGFRKSDISRHLTKKYGVFCCIKHNS